jgi:hypothetical protein
MDGPKKKTWRTRRAAIAVALIIVVAGTSYYAYSAYASAGVRCEFVPGNAMYIQLVSSNSSAPLANVGVKGWLYAACPFAFSGSAPPNPKNTIVGNWNFVTNSTGYVSIPSSELAGYTFTFNVPFEAQIYQFIVPVCGGGTTTVKVELPSGYLHGMESGGETSVSTAANGTQIIHACGGPISANATVVP